MDKTKPNASDKSDGIEKAEQSSTFSKDPHTRRWIKNKMLQIDRLIWLDNSIDDNNDDCRNTVNQLRQVAKIINTFTDTDQCVDFLTDIHNQNIFMIISDALYQNIVPLIHDAAELCTIFIFCRKKTACKQWSKTWSKITGVFTEISSICEAIKQATQQIQQNAISISFVQTDGDVFNKKLDQLDCSFMYTQILKEILLTIRFEEKHIKDFFKHCRDAFNNNDQDINKIQKLEQKYHDETPIWWYTQESIFYSRLNHALRVMDVDVIIKMGFFIYDLHCHIQQLHSKQFTEVLCNRSLTVYRGQGISETDFNQMQKTKGGLISFNNFLSTSKTRDVSLIFAESNATNSDLIGILFTIMIDPSKSTTPFASISDVSQFDEEDEVLFSMHTVFRIDNINPTDGNHRLFQVDLTLTKDNDKDLRRLTDYIRQETLPDEEGWYRLGLALLKMGQSDKAQQVYQVLFDQTTNNGEKAPIYNQLACAKRDQGEYEKAKTFLEKSIEIQQQSLPSNHLYLAASFNNIGTVYENMGEYLKAVSSYEKSLGIQQQSLPSNHPDFAASYNNIGSVYQNMGEYSKALLSYEKSLEIRQQSFPSNHPHLAMSYNNIGMVYENMGEYSKAVSSYKKSLEIRQQSLPSNHPDLAASYHNIGNVYYNMGEYSKALSFYQKSLEIRQQSLPSNHPHLAASYHSIGNVYRSMGEYSKALSSNQKSLEIRQQSLPSNHPDLAQSYNSIGSLYGNMGEYSKALLSYEKSLGIRQQSLPSNHPDLAASYNNIGMVYGIMGEYSKSLLSYEKSLGIQQQSLPSNHPDLANSYNNIGNVYYNMGEYSKALSFYQKSLEIRQQSLPSNHPDLAASYNNIGSVYRNMGEYSNALSSHQKSLEIKQQSLPSNHPDLAASYNNIGLVYHSIGEYSKARSFYERAVNIAQHSLSPNHPHLKIFRRSLEYVEKKL